jgi:hypothetical protein
MLSTEAVVISEWYDFESVSSLAVFCECGARLSDEALEFIADEAP